MRTISLTITIAFVAANFTVLHCKPASASTVSYDANAFPDEEGWNRTTGLLFGNRYVEDGWLVQQEQAVPYDRFLVDQDEFYTRSIAEFAGAEAFFLEWRMETDGPREGFPNVSPAAIVLGGSFSQASYHFTIARDQARLIRGSLLPLVFVDIEPGVAHTYRIELYGNELYRWLIDGQIVDEGIPRGFYPGTTAEIVFGARAAGEPITARWDYIRYGTIPEPATALLLVAGTWLLFRHRPPRRR